MPKVLQLLIIINIIQICLIFFLTGIQNKYFEINICDRKETRSQSDVSIPPRNYNIKKNIMGKDWLEQFVRFRIKTIPTFPPPMQYRSESCYSGAAPGLPTLIDGDGETCDK